MNLVVLSHLQPLYVVNDQDAI